MLDARDACGGKDEKPAVGVSCWDCQNANSEANCEGNRRLKLEIHFAGLLFSSQVLRKGDESGYLNSVI
jgi:hypothetical protein